MHFEHGGNVRFDKVKDRNVGGYTSTGYFDSGNKSLEVWIERQRDSNDSMVTVAAGIRLNLYETGRGQTELFHFYIPGRVAKALVKLGEGLTEFREIFLTGESAVMSAVIAETYGVRV